LPEQKGLPA